MEDPHGSDQRCGQGIVRGHAGGRGPTDPFGPEGRPSRGSAVPTAGSWQGGTPRCAGSGR